MDVRHRKSQWNPGMLASLLALVLWIVHPIAHPIHAHAPHDHAHSHQDAPSKPEPCPICLAGSKFSPDLIEPASLPEAPILVVLAGHPPTDQVPKPTFCSPTTAPRSPPAGLSL